jgi:hypothetical protein
MQRDKGTLIEREIVELHGRLGLRAGLVPLSGTSQCRRKGADVDIYPWATEAPLCGDMKARANGAGSAMLERWLGENFPALRRNFAERLIVVPWRIWARLLLRRRV